jgi:zinc transport system substrate-binding protein
MARFSARLAAVFVMIAAMCAWSDAKAADRESIFVSIAPQKFLVERLVGDAIEVHVLLPSGASPATYEPTPKKMAALGTASLFFLIGAPFEGPVLDKISRVMPDLQTVDCRSGVELVPMDDHGHGHGGSLFDPHIWLDPLRMKIVASTTADALEKLLPEAGPEIQHNLQRLHHAIDQSHALIASILEPHTGEHILVFHPAFGYFTRRYGLHQIAVEDEGKAPSARRLAEVVRTLDDGSVTAIFVQPQFSTSAAQRIADALECEVVILDPLAEIYLTNLEIMADRIAASLRN